MLATTLTKLDLVLLIYVTTAEILCVLSLQDDRASALNNTRVKGSKLRLFAPSAESVSDVVADRVVKSESEH